MRKLFILLMVLGVVAVFSTASYADIAGTAHDFSAETWSGGQICVVCHTPHNADTSVTDSPLWNHDVTAATFTLYDTSTLDATDLGQPDGASKLCLSCHDGTVAVDSFGGASGTDYIIGDPLIGTDLSDDHPVSFTYDAALATADGELEDPTVGLSGLGATIQADMLINDKMECASCHDVHGVGIASFLRKSNAGSALCLTCHIK